MPRRPEGDTGEPFPYSTHDLGGAVDLKGVTMQLVTPEPLTPTEIRQMSEVAADIVRAGHYASGSTHVGGHFLRAGDKERELLADGLINGFNLRESVALGMVFSSLLPDTCGFDAYSVRTQNRALVFIVVHRIVGGKPKAIIFGDANPFDQS